MKVVAEGFVEQPERVEGEPADPNSGAKLAGSSWRGPRDPLKFRAAGAGAAGSQAASQAGSLNRK